MESARHHRIGPAARHLIHAIAVEVRQTRLAFGWSQRELARRASTSQATISRIEAGRMERTDLLVVGRTIDALALRAELRLESRVAADRARQRDAGHVRGVAYIASHLERSGWEVRREVAVGGATILGWIDILAFRRSDGALLVVEFKTEIVDVGAIERSIGLYEREARRAAQGLGWQPTTIRSALIVLDTSASAARVRSNRDAFEHSFSARARDLLRWLVGPTAAGGTFRRAMAMVDPLSRRQTWLREPAGDRRRALPKYPDYADFIRHLTSKG